MLGSAATNCGMVDIPLLFGTNVKERKLHAVMSDDYNLPGRLAAFPARVGAGAAGAAAPPFPGGIGAAPRAFAFWIFRAVLIADFLSSRNCARVVGAKKWARGGGGRE